LLDLLRYELEDHLLEEFVEYGALVLHLDWIDQTEEDFEHLTLFNFVDLQEAVLEEILEEADAQILHHKLLERLMLLSFPHLKYLFD